MVSGLCSDGSSFFYCATGRTIEVHLDYVLFVGAVMPSFSSFHVASALSSFKKVQILLVLHKFSFFSFIQINYIAE